jgi:hypothetical protein
MPAAVGVCVCVCEDVKWVQTLHGAVSMCTRVCVHVCEAGYPPAMEPRTAAVAAPAAAADSAGTHMKLRRC